MTVVATIPGLHGNNHSGIHGKVARNPQEIGIRAFDLHAGYFSGNNSGRILNSVEDTVADFVNDIIDGNRSARILETTTAMIAGSGRKQGAVGGQDVEAQESQFFDYRNQGMKDLLIESFSNTDAKVGEARLTGDAIVGNAGKTAEVPTAQRVTQDTAEVLDGADSFQITEQVEKEKGDGIVAGSAENGICIGRNGADEREIDDGSDQLTDTVPNGTVVVDVDEFLPKFVMREPTSLFLGKEFTVTAIDERIDFAELSDNISNREAGEFAHLKAPRVSREDLQPSKTLPGTPFLLVNANHPQFPDPIQTNASDSSLSTNAGSTALRSLSCTWRHNG
jgi:hypothetical protein